MLSWYSWPNGLSSVQHRQCPPQIERPSLFPCAGDRLSEAIRFGDARMIFATAPRHGSFTRPDSAPGTPKDRINPLPHCHCAGSGWPAEPAPAGARRQSGMTNQHLAADHRSARRSSPSMATSAACR